MQEQYWHEKAEYLSEQRGRKACLQNVLPKDLFQFFFLYEFSEFKKANPKDRWSTKRLNIHVFPLMEEQKSLLAERLTDESNLFYFIFVL